jgi:hypothetical protein
VTTGATEIETHKTSFSKSKRLAFLASFNPDIIAKVNEAGNASAVSPSRKLIQTGGSSESVNMIFRALNFPGLYRSLHGQ